MAWEPQTGAPDPSTPGLPVRIVGADTNGSLGATPNPYTSKVTRAYKNITADNQTTGQTLYTVTAGKKLYILSVNVSAYNTGAAARLRIKDNTTVVFPMSIANTGLGALSGAIALGGLPSVFPEPLQFSTSVVIDIPSGTLVYSLMMVGYEE